MNVSLTPELEALIAAKVKSGRYQTASEVVREALRVFEEREWLRERKIEALQKEILAGLESGPSVSAEEVFQELREKLAARQPRS